ncbi:hypothetical protein MMC25_007069 [Agyrium rufum]|nr:hypothetical protein [Agyrium rufum]
MPKASVKALSNKRKNADRPQPARAPKRQKKTAASASTFRHAPIANEDEEDDEALTRGGSRDSAEDSNDGEDGGTFASLALGILSKARAARGRRAAKPVDEYVTRFQASVIEQKGVLTDLLVAKGKEIEAVHAEEDRAFKKQVIKSIELPSSVLPSYPKPNAMTSAIRTPADQERLARSNHPFAKHTQSLLTCAKELLQTYNSVGIMIRTSGEELGQVGEDWERDWKAVETIIQEGRDSIGDRIAAVLEGRQSYDLKKESIQGEDHGGGSMYQDRELSTSLRKQPLTIGQNKDRDDALSKAKENRERNCHEDGLWSKDILVHDDTEGQTTGHQSDRREEVRTKVNGGEWGTAVKRMMKGVKKMVLTIPEAP